MSSAALQLQAVRVRAGLKWCCRLGLWSKACGEFAWEISSSGQEGGLLGRWDGIFEGWRCDHDDVTVNGGSEESDDGRGLFGGD